MNKLGKLIPKIPFDAVHSALDILIPVAKGHTHQSGHVADFLLAWWNADELGGFPVWTLGWVDDELRQAMAVILSFLSQNPIMYADQWGRRNDIEIIIDRWRT